MNAEVSLDDVQRDADLQMRDAGVDPAVVAEYMDAMEDGAEFPCVILFRDDAGYWPGDGFHRIDAARRLGRETIAADVRDGGRRAALLFAAGANANHGLRRTQADKRRSVTALLTDPEWSKWTDRAIGKACAVDHKTVAKVRRELTGDFPTERTYTTKHGTTATMETANIGAPANGESMVEKMLSKVSDDVLIAECRRRGLKVVQ